MDEQIPPEVAKVEAKVPFIYTAMPETGSLVATRCTQALMLGEGKEGGEVNPVRLLLLVANCTLPLCVASS
jgi:hypothetical protein